MLNGQNKIQFNKGQLMNGLSKLTKGVSIALASAMLMAHSSPILESNLRERSEVIEEIEEVVPNEVGDIYFNSEDCSKCRYVTIYDEEARLVLDKLVNDITDIKDEKINKLLEKSDFLMSNSITNYYILSK